MTKMDDEEETKPTDRECTIGEMTNTNEEEPTMPQATQRSKVGSNDVNMTPPNISFMHYIRDRI
jgi:hypothetical protein